MTGSDDLADSTPTLPFDTFWDWVVTHPNCILRAGSREVVLYDDEDYHWHFAQEGHESLLVQVIRGKRLVGELLIPKDRVAYVQGVLGDQEGEFLFELISGDEHDQGSVYFFVLSHGFESAEDEPPRRIH
jgi:hypothetical protein